MEKFVTILEQKKKSLEERNINVLVWSATSTDLNIIENVWFYDVLKVYKKGKQCNSFKGLKYSIYTAWDSIDPDYLKQLVSCVPDRVAQCLTIKGSPTNY